MHFGSTANCSATSIAASHALIHPINHAITIQCSIIQSTKPPNTTATHLTNLDRLLGKQTPLEPAAPISKHVKHPTKNTADNSLVLKIRKTIISALTLNPSVRQQTTCEYDEISPRSLTHLQNLLSNTSHPSPRASIASNWRFYHGASDWQGLLDPLDPNLRRELIRYGEFVQAAYHAFHSQPSASPLETTTNRTILPDRAYRVTRNLYATVSMQLPTFIDNFAPWMTQRSSLIGYVAVCDSEREIQRMGRRDVVIALRGTSTCLEWAENIRTNLVNLENNLDNSTNPKVECGFQSLYKTSAPNIPSLSSTIIQEVQQLVEKYSGEELSITVTGHSLGAALAVLVADELKQCGAIPSKVSIAVISFGSPRVGNQDFANKVEGQGVKVLRIVNAHDLVTRVPGALVWSDGYSHVGKELRVDSKLSPYLKENADPGCCHDLEAYLHLIDGFIGSKCPFRANAKRSLGKLLSEQGANVKKLYVSKAGALEVPRELVVRKFARCGSGQLASPSSVCSIS